MMSRSPQLRAALIVFQSEFQAGRNALWAVHLSQPHHMSWTSSELQPWIISSRSKSLSLFIFFFYHRLCRTNHQVLVTISTLAVQNEETGRTVVVCLCLTEVKFAKLCSELDVKRRAYVSNRAKKKVCMDTHHALVKTWLPVILLRRGSAAVCRSWCLHSDRPLVDSRSVCNNCSNYSEKRWRTAGETAEWRDLARASLTIIASLLPFIFLVLARRLWTKTCSYALFSLHCGSSSAIH